MHTRYYLHGDQNESQIDLYYCACCDFFEKREHFTNGFHPDVHQERYIRELKCLKKNVPLSYYRPKLALNLFAHLPKPRRPKTSRFYRWLIRQVDREDPVGDLAGDAKRDSSYPLGSDSLKTVRSYLISQGACNEALQTLEEAWAEFKANSSARSGLSPKV